MYDEYIELYNEVITKDMKKNDYVSILSPKHPILVKIMSPHLEDNFFPDKLED